MKITVRKELDKVVGMLNSLTKKKYMVTGSYGKIHLSVAINGDDTAEGVIPISEMNVKEDMSNALR